MAIANRTHSPSPVGSRTGARFSVCQTSPARHCPSIVRRLTRHSISLRRSQNSMVIVILHLNIGEKSWLPSGGSVPLI